MGKKPTTPPISIPEVLVEAVKSKRVIPFLGAGTATESKNSAGKQPPDADQLRDILALKFFGKLIPNRDVMAVSEMAISSAGGTGLVYEADHSGLYSDSRAVRFAFWRTLGGFSFRSITVERRTFPKIRVQSISISSSPHDASRLTWTFIAKPSNAINITWDIDLTSTILSRSGGRCPDQRLLLRDERTSIIR
jgi:hypothetical protein